MVIDIFLVIIILFSIYILIYLLIYYYLPTTVLEYYNYRKEAIQGFELRAQAFVEVQALKCSALSTQLLSHRFHTLVPYFIMYEALYWVRHALSP